MGFICQDVGNTSLVKQTQVGTRAMSQHRPVLNFTLIHSSVLESMFIKFQKDADLWLVLSPQAKMMFSDLPIFQPFITKTNKIQQLLSWKLCYYIIITPLK